jgi:two-component system sensor histidine kinase LytS
VKSKGHVLIHAYTKDEKMYVLVEDDGKGMTKDETESLGKHAVKSKEGTGTALVNIRERLEGIYNMKAGIHIHSEEGIGTKVLVTIPLDKKGVYENHVKGFYSR